MKKLTRWGIAFSLLLVKPIAHLSAQALYDENTITSIQLTFTDPNWDQTLDTYYVNDLDERLIATCVVNGITFDSVGVKYKGNSTYSANNGKNPLNIKLNHIKNQDYNGYTTLKLSNGKNDPSFVREVLSYKIGRKYMDMPLSNYAKVSINGNVHGMYSCSESINGDFQVRYLNAAKNNTRFKCNPANTQDGSSLKYLGTDSTLYYSYYELKSNAGWGDMPFFTNNLLNNTGSLETFLDVDRAIWMIAFDNVMANLDSYIGPFRQNYYMIKDNNDRMVPVIWDLNECIGGFEMVNLPSGGPPSPPSLTDLTQMDVLLRKSDTEYPLVKAILQNARYQRMYIAHCKTILEENINNGAYKTEANAMRSLISTEVANDPNAFYSSAEFNSNLTSQVGSGMSATYGVTQVLDARSSYLMALNEFTATAPTITSIAPDSSSAFATINITADVSSANYVQLSYRYNSTEIFQKLEMFDDGAHGDGAAGDGNYGATVVMGPSNLEYYIYAENSNAGMFAPQRAEHEFYSVGVISDLVINELMASNKFTEVDEFDEFDDWIELYNNTANPISLHGYYLSDDVNDLTKWPCPNVSIPAKGYYIIWADNDSIQGPNHANFKLSASGDAVFLADTAGTIVDEVSFGTQVSDTSYGRYPNGTGSFTKMLPTFSAENSNIAANTGLVDVSWTDNKFRIYPNPASDILFIEKTDGNRVQLEVYTMLGELIYSEKTSTTHQLDVSGWTRGMYWVRIGNATQKLLLK